MRRKASTPEYTLVRQGFQFAQRCNPNSIISKISKGLNADNYQKFSQLCFGSFLELGGMQNQGQLLGLMLESLTPESLNKKRMSFIFSEKEYVLGPVEWFLITGLSFNGAYKYKDHSKFHDEVFKGLDRLLLNDLESKFDEVVLKDGGKCEVSLKLALLLVLYGILLVKDKYARKLDLHYMHLVDDLEDFCYFPWGLLSYDFMVTHSHQSRCRIETAKQDGRGTSCDGNGFTYALQVFAYEVHSGFAGMCAHKRTSMVVRTPRMLHWETTKAKVSYTDLLGLLSFDCSETSMTPTPMERAALEDAAVPNDLIGNVDVACFEHNIQLKADLNSLRKKTVVDCSESQFEEPVHETYESEKRMRCSQEKEVGAPSYVGALSKSKLQSTPPKVKGGGKIGSHRGKDKNSHGAKLGDDSGPPTSRQMDTVIGKISQSVRVLQEIARSLAGKALPSNGTSTCELGPCTNEKQDVTHSKEEMEADVVIIDGVEFTGRVTPEKVHPSPPSGTVGIVQRRRQTRSQTRVSQMRKAKAFDAPSSVQKPASSAPEAGKQPTSGAPRRGAKKKPPKIIEYGQTDVEFPLMLPDIDWKIKFQKWCRENWHIDAPWLTNLPCVGHQHATWFEGIWALNGWLLPAHMDCILHMLLQRSRFWPDIFNKQWTAIDSAGWRGLTSDKEHVLRNQFKPYVVGRWPNGYGVPWKEASKIVGIGCIEPDHWISYELNLEEQRIVVYDSLSMSTDSELTRNALKQAALNLGWICRECALWKSIRPVGGVKESWDICIYEHPPQQGNSLNSGIFSLKFLECIVTGNDLEILDEVYMEKFRRQYCVSIFRAALEGEEAYRSSLV